MTPPDAAFSIYTEELMFSVGELSLTMRSQCITPSVIITRLDALQARFSVRGQLSILIS
jgi:hypothetical protein